MDPVERIGMLVDKADNFLMYKIMMEHLHPSVKINALLHGLAEIRQELRDIYHELGGEHDADLPLDPPVRIKGA